MHSNYDCDGGSHALSDTVLRILYSWFIMLAKIRTNIKLHTLCGVKCVCCNIGHEQRSQK